MQSNTETSQRWYNPTMLIWMREQSGFNDPGEVDKELDLADGTIASWEQERSDPTIANLRLVTRLYDYPLSYCFLSATPIQPPITDYRGRSLNGNKTFSRETMQALREFRRLVRLSRVLHEMSGTDTEFKKRANSEQMNSPLALAAGEMVQLGITKEQRDSWKDSWDAFWSWRLAIEGQGIITISLPLPSKECRGAAIYEESSVPSVLTNSNEASTAQSFTLLHEYAHLIRRSSGLVVCDQFPSEEETFANRFAAFILVPTELLRAELNSKGLNIHREWWSDDQLRDLARPFRVSLDVIAIRLETLDLAPSGFYRRKREMWDQRRQSSGGGIGRTINKRERARVKFGNRLFEQALDAVDRGHLSAIDLADYFGQVRRGERPWLVQATDVEQWHRERSIFQR
jgi:Zn-dependent peptidase ImmA (M78 family)